MSTRTPTPDGLTVQPNAPVSGTNPAASVQELENGSFWGRYALLTQLPNIGLLDGSTVAGVNPADPPAYDKMRPGDTALVGTSVYWLVNRGTPGGNDAEWSVGAIFGTQRNYASNEPGSTTGSATLATLLSFAPTLPAGTYRISWGMEIQCTTGAVAVANMRCDIDATSGSSADGTKVNDVSEFSQLSIYNSISGWGEFVLTSGAHTIRLKIANSTGTGTVVWRSARLEMFRVA